MLSHTHSHSDTSLPTNKESFREIAFKSDGIYRNIKMKLPPYERFPSQYKMYKKNGKLSLEHFNNNTRKKIIPPQKVCPNSRSFG